MYKIKKDILVKHQELRIEMQSLNSYSSKLRQGIHG